ncbi:MAG: hypothetical protein VKI83_03875 [Synechococcaceae cyanobacterium]|nr:hypothetical protein [Synechococcaceae cyanobacterium]
MTPSPESLQERYAAIERVYAEQDWSGVEDLSRSLLAELPEDPSDPLRQRLVLLLAHTRLYGAGDAAAAASLYQAVAAAAAEPVLTEIATQGLQQCNQLLQPGDASPATPWLQQLAGSGAPSPAGSAAAPSRAPFQQAPNLEPVDVIEEPELIELALADPERQDLVTVEPEPETPPAPLRWPFMADYEERRLPGSMPGQGQPLDDGIEPSAPPTLTPEPGPGSSRAVEPEAEAATTTPEATGRETEAEQMASAAGGAQPQVNAAARKRSGFSPEELAELARGLLEVPIR